MKILVIALRALGDMVLITPILRLLKRSQPSVELTVIADAIGYEVLLNNPHIDHLVVIDRNQNRRLSLAKRLQKELRFLSDLRAKQFDIAVDLFGGPRSALMALLSRAPIRCGEYTPKRLRNWFYTHCAPVSREGEHLVLQKLKIIRSLITDPVGDIPLELFLTEEEKEWGVQCLNRYEIREGEVLVGFFPGAGWGYRRWPPEKFAALGDRLTKSLGVRIVLIGGIGDREACQQVSSRMSVPSIMLIQESVRESTALINRLDLFVSNDTGPMHIAVALGRPTIALFGPGNTVKYGPRGANVVIITKNLPCSPCPQWFDPCHQVGRDSQECMKKIEVEEVYQAVTAFLKQVKARERISPKNGFKGYQ